MHDYGVHDDTRWEDWEDWEHDDPMSMQTTRHRAVGLALLVTTLLAKNAQCLRRYRECDRGIATQREPCERRQGPGRASPARPSAPLCTHSPP